MARRVKLDPRFIFDRPDEDQAVVREERPGFIKRLRSFLQSRFALLAVVFLLAGLLILYQTAALQLNQEAAAGVAETVGVSRQMRIQAPRGDILDASGQALAYSQPTFSLQLSYAGLDTRQLNEMLLDLSYLLEEYDVDWSNPLAEYLQLREAASGLTDEAQEADLRAMFRLDWEKILYWQIRGGPFSLKNDPDVAATRDNDQVKRDPELFFDYLRYKVFQIELPEADGQKYTRADAYRIMCLRYLIYVNNWTFINGQPIALATDVDPKLIQMINEQNYRFQGVLTTLTYERRYTEAASKLSHVIGYVGQINADQYYQWQNQGYLPDAIVGQGGVELTAERYLAGLDGIKPYNVWSVAGVDGTFYPEDIGRDAVPGYDVRLTIDLELQTVAEKSLFDVINEIRNSPDNKNKGDADAGSVVMLDVRTGAVLAMASYPDYEPADFINQRTDAEAAKRVQTYLTDQVNKPMLNRAMMEIYAPGSTFKPVTAVAALQTETITTSRNTIRCKGHEVIGDWLWYCLERPSSGHGDLSLTRATATSCNLYFFNLGVRTGIDNIDYWGKQLGLGTITGIDLPGEAQGYRASRETKKLLRSNPADQIWFPADTCQSSIGQLDNSFTILQLAVYTAGLATGNRVTPYVIDTVTRADGVIIRENEGQVVPNGISEETLEAVRTGMKAVASTSDGTAWRYFHDFPISVAAKTGTAETGFEDRSSSNGLFICYAPADNPEVAIAQIVEKGAWGSNTIRIAKDLLTTYFHLDEQSGNQMDIRPGLVGIEPPENNGETTTDGTGN